MNVEAVPVRYGDAVVAVLTHQTGVGDVPKSSQLETAYLDCAADLRVRKLDGDHHARQHHFVIERQHRQREGFTH